MFSSRCRIGASDLRGASCASRVCCQPCATRSTAATAAPRISSRTAATHRVACAASKPFEPERVTQIQQALIREHYLTGTRMANGMRPPSPRCRSIRPIMAGKPSSCPTRARSRALASVPIIPRHSTPADRAFAGARLSDSRKPSHKTEASSPASGVRRERQSNFLLISPSPRYFSVASKSAIVSRLRISRAFAPSTSTSAARGREL